MRSIDVSALMVSIVLIALCMAHCGGLFSENIESDFDWPSVLQ
uniref:Uncharacterized protein n=1 Tax=Arundo donax TaxID=35708 RepID=A0A0A9EAE7_ARUDO